MLARGLAVGVIALLLAPPALARAQPSGNVTASTPSWFQEKLNAAVEEVKGILLWVKEAALDIGRVLSGVLIAIGVVMWASDVFSYRGRRLITAGVILYFILELLA